MQYFLQYFHILQYFLQWFKKIVILFAILENICNTFCNTWKICNCYCNTYCNALWCYNTKVLQYFAKVLQYNTIGTTPVRCYRILSLHERVELQPLAKNPVRAELSSVEILLVESISDLKKYSISVTLLLSYKKRGIKKKYYDKIYSLISIILN